MRAIAAGGICTQCCYSVVKIQPFSQFSVLNMLRSVKKLYYPIRLLTRLITVFDYLYIKPWIYYSKIIVPMQILIFGHIRYKYFVVSS